MKKAVRVAFDEQSKSVVATVSVEYTNDDATTFDRMNDVALKEAQELFDKAQNYSIQKTMVKHR